MCFVVSGAKHHRLPAGFGVEVVRNSSQPRPSKCAASVIVGKDSSIVESPVERRLLLPPEQQSNP